MLYGEHPKMKATLSTLHKEEFKKIDDEVAYWENEYNNDRYHFIYLESSREVKFLIWLLTHEYADCESCEELVNRLRAICKKRFLPLQPTLLMVNNDKTTDSGKSNMFSGLFNLKKEKKAEPSPEFEWEEKTKKEQFDNGDTVIYCIKSLSRVIGAEDAKILTLPVVRNTYHGKSSNCDYYNRHRINHDAFRNCAKLEAVYICEDNDLGYYDGIGISNCDTIKEIILHPKSRVYIDFFTGRTNEGLFYVEKEESDGTTSKRYLNITVVPGVASIRLKKDLVTEYKWSNLFIIDDVPTDKAHITVIDHVDVQYEKDIVISKSSEKSLSLSYGEGKDIIVNVAESDIDIDGSYYRDKNALIVGFGAFALNTKIKSIKEPKSSYFKSSKLLPIEDILPFAFTGASSLEEFSIPKSIRTIKTGVFAMCTALKKVNLHENLYNLDKLSFAHCTSLENFSFKHISNVSERAFLGCTTLQSVILSKGTKFGDYVFENCTGIKKVEIKGSGYKKSVGLFYGCTSLQKVIYNIDDEFDTGISMFEGCSSLVSIPKLHSPKESAFKGCSSLKNVEIVGGEVGKSAFESCTGIEKITLINVYNIKEEAFLGCSLVTEIVVKNPEHTVEIGSKAFSGMPKLKKVTLIAEHITVDKQAFYDSNIKECELITTRKIKKGADKDPALREFGSIKTKLFGLF